MRITVLLLSIFLISQYSFAQVNIYDASTISAELLKNASSVKRFESIDFKVNNAASGSYKVRQVITVLDANGKDELTFYEHSNKFRSLDNAFITVYDSKGKELNSYKKKDMRTVAASDEDVDDIKITYFNVSAASYPITVDFEYDFSIKGFFNYQSYFMKIPGQSVEKSTYTATVPKDLDLRYKAMHTGVKPSIADDNKGKNKIYSWACTNLAATAMEPGAGSGSSYLPWILIAPNRIDFDGYKGDVSTWKGMGLWYNNLVKDMIVVPDEVKTEMQNVVKGAPSDLEKAKLIYNYLQQNFRYVSIQLGIGGLKPFSASYVHTKKYGDCKALSNYMQACLQSVNVKSYNAWITSSLYPPDIDPAFAYDPFNHQILCIISGKDTTWLECTSNTMDFGRLGNQTENRYALLLKETGGELVRTPVSKATDNLFIANSKIDLDEDASGKISTLIKAKGEFKEELIYVSALTLDKQKSYFTNYLEFPNSDKHNTVFSDLKEKTSSVTMEMFVEKIPAFKAGSKMFLNPRAYAIWQQKMPPAENRKQDFYFNCPFDKIDSTVYQLPANYSLETLPKGKDIQFEYGSFKTNYSYNEEKKTILTTAHLVLNVQKISTEKYSAVRKFFNAVIEEYTDKIVIKKN